MRTVNLDIVPDPDDASLALPFTAFTADGTTVRALLDSGAARSSVVQRAGVVRSAVTGVGRGAFGVAVEEELTDLHVHFAGRDLGSMCVAVIPEDFPGHGDLIGQDVLSQFRCEYRLGEGLLILDGEDPGLDHEVFLDEMSHVYAEVRWPSGESAQAVLDTGAAVTVVDCAFVERHPSLFEPDGQSEGMDVSGQTVSTPMMTMAPMTLLGSGFDASKVAIVDLSSANATLTRPMDLILGWPILSRGTFYVDHGRGLAAHRN